MSHAPGVLVRLIAAGFAVAVFAASAAPALAAEGEEGGLSGRAGNLGQAVMILFVFAGLLFILTKYAWKPIIAQIQRREKEIGERIKDTEKRNREAKELEAHYQSRLDRAEADAKQLLAKNLEEAARAREELLAAARDEGNRTIEAAKAEIDAYKQAALEDLRQATASMAVNIAGEIIQQQLSPEKQDELVTESLGRIRARAGRQDT